MKLLLIIICIALFSCENKKVEYKGGLKAGDTVIFIREPGTIIVKIDTVFIHDTIYKDHSLNIRDNNGDINIDQR